MQISFLASWSYPFIVAGNVILQIMRSLEITIAFFFYVHIQSLCALRTLTKKNKQPARLCELQRLWKHAEPPALLFLHSPEQPTTEAKEYVWAIFPSRNSACVFNQKGLGGRTNCLRAVWDQFKQRQCFYLSIYFNILKLGVFWVFWLFLFLLRRAPALSAVLQMSHGGPAASLPSCLRNYNQCV